MIEYARIYHFYRNPLIKIFRLLVLFLLLYLFLSGFITQLNLNAYALTINNQPINPDVFKPICCALTSAPTWLFPFSLLSVFLMLEIFFNFKIARKLPDIAIAKNNGDYILDSFTIQALDVYISGDRITSVIKHLLHQNTVRFILQKSDIQEKEIALIDISKEELTKKSFELAKKMNGLHATTMDLFASYLLLTEEKTKLLFNKKLKKEEFLQILQWARLRFIHEERPNPIRVKFWGEGIGEGLVTGWTLETKKFANNFTAYALRHEPILIGRQDEFRKMIEILSKRENNNVLLVGEAGIGKSNLIEALAYESFVGTLPSGLNYLHIYELLIGPLIAGATSRGELETRLQALIAEIAHTGNVMLYIPEFQNILGATSFQLDISGALVPYLREGVIPIIATMTPGKYKEYLQENPLKEVLEVIFLEEPKKETAFEMLFEKSSEIEHETRVILTYRSIKAAVDLADRYEQDSVLPGSAVRLLQDCAHSVALAKKYIVEEEDVVRETEIKTHIAVSEPKEAEKELLLHLEDKIHERLIDQEEAVHQIAEALRRIRTGLAFADKPTSFLFLGPTGVGKTETAKTLASLYFGGEDKMVRLDMSEYKTDEGIKRLLGASPGEGSERGELTEKVHDHPFSLVLLDEFEKAHPQILDLFLQVLDDGRLTDNKGRTVTFQNTMIIATSNAGSEFIREEVQKGTAIDKTFEQKLTDLLQTQGIFKPELLNRFDAIITFKPLGQQEVYAIIQLFLKKLSRTLSEKDITVLFENSIVEKIAQEGFNKEFGARPISRFIQDNIEDLIAQKILRGQIQRGGVAKMLVDSNNTIQVNSNTL